VLAAAGSGGALHAALARIRDWGHDFASYGPADYIGSIHYFIGCGVTTVPSCPSLAWAWRGRVDWPVAFLPDLSQADDQQPDSGVLTALPKDPDLRIWTPVDLPDQKAREVRSAGKGSKG
jgi:hypothetical protein